jgi:heterodisulfide reductase subunit A/quinone-modifying oxidoreductase subunit QmoB
MEKIVPKIGLFIWDQGGRLAGAVDLQALAKRFSKVKGVTRFEVLADPWAATFADSAREGVNAGQIDRFLWVGRFTPEQKKRITDPFASLGVNPHLHGWCDLEEQGLLLQGIAPEIRQRKAQALMEMAVAEIRLRESPEPVKIPASDAVLIVGAGVAGIHTALSLADVGKRVFLLEKESGVGGKVALLSRFYPRICDPRCGLEFVLEKLSRSDLVSLRTRSTVSAVGGSPGNFLVKILSGPRFVNTERCNGCGACAKVCPKDVSFPFSRAISVCTANPPGVGGLLSNCMKAIHPSMPMPFPASYVVEREHCPVDCRECEKACPTEAVNLEENPSQEELRVGAILVTTGWDPYPIENVKEYGYGRLPNVISNLEMEHLLSGNGVPLAPFKDVGFVQCVGSRDERHLRYCSSVCCSVALKQILHFKGLMPEARCHVFYMDMRSAGFEEDLYRRARDMGDVFFHNGRPATIEPGKGSGRLSVTVSDPDMGGVLTMSLDLMVLAGGMCPSYGTKDLAETLHLPQNGYHFFESHHQCFPEESQRQGIYVGGCAREPMNVARAIESAHRAAMRALPLLQSTLEIAPFYPVVEKTKCDQCKRCTEDCPFAAFLFDEKGFPYPDLARCRQCGNCMGTCPLAAISLRNHSVKQLAAQIAVLEKPFMPKKDPMILAFLCENDAYKAATSAAGMGLPVPPNVVGIKVPCAGSVNNALVADALSIGIDGVLIFGCKDDECHYIRGSQLVRKRSGDLSEKLQKMRIEPKRVRFENLEIREAEHYVGILNDYINTLKQMGPNPFKI